MAAFYHPVGVIHTYGKEINILVESMYKVISLSSLFLYTRQSVTGVTHADDVNSYWVVRGPHGEHCNRG